MILFGGLSGGVSSHLAGGSFGQGFSQGIITAGLNHALHGMADAMKGGGSVRITITDQISLDANGNPKMAVVYAYPPTSPLELYEVPVYLATVEGTDANGNPVVETFDVIRFGVSSDGGREVVDFLNTTSRHSAGTEYSVTASRMGAFKKSEIPMLRVDKVGGYYLHPFPSLSSGFASGLVGCVGIPNYNAFYKTVTNFYGGNLSFGTKYNSITVNYMNATTPSLLKSLNKVQK